MKDLIEERIAILEKEREEALKEFMRQVNEELRKVRAPYDLAIKELRALINLEDDYGG